MKGFHKEYSMKAKLYYLTQSQGYFYLIYEHKEIPAQWSKSNIIPIFKKGSKTCL